MENQELESISVNGKAIHWAVRSGVAVGVQKYTKTHVTGGSGDSAPSSRIETIIEFSIQQKNGNEIEMEIKDVNLRVRDGQRVSVVSGYTESKGSDWLIFVKHGSKEWNGINEWYWLNGRYSFFGQLGIFEFFPRWIIVCLVLAASYVVFGFVQADFFYYLLATFGVSIIRIPVIIIIIFWIIQVCRVESAWTKIKPRITEIARQLRY
jgi:hypothetical protein